MHKIKSVIVIQAIYAFLSGILYILLPLMMVERRIDVVTMGLIFGSVPLVFQLLRLFFAALSDHYGRKKFFFLHGIFTAISSAIYYFAYSPFQFLLGKIAEAVRDASIWSSNRAFILQHTKDKHHGLIVMRTVDNAFGAFGSLLAGFLIAYLLFSNTLVFVFAIGLLIIPLSHFLKAEENSRGSLKKVLSSLNFFKRSHVFKKFIIAYFLAGLSDGLTSTYVFPFFLAQKLFSIETIGILLGVQGLLAALSIYLFRKMSLTKALLFGGIFDAFLLLSLAFSSGVMLLSIILMLGFATGIISITYEGFFSKIADHKSYGSDIGILLLGFHTGRTITLSISGLFISSFGFFTLFAFSALFSLAYSFYSLRNLKGNR